MAAEGPGIMQHDLAMDLADSFYWRHDEGEPVKAIVTALQDELGFPELDIVEKHIFWCALLECLWQVGASTAGYDEILVNTYDQQAFEQYWGESLPARNAAVQQLFEKIERPKPKPRKAQAKAKNAQPIFQPGDHLLFKRSNGRTSLLVFWGTERVQGVQYYFAVPNLTRAADPLLIERFLRFDPELSERELAAFYTDKQRFRSLDAKQTLVVKHQSQFRWIGNRMFPPSQWKPYGGSPLPAATLEEFEHALNGCGARSLSAKEVELAQVQGPDAS